MTGPVAERSRRPVSFRRGAARPGERRLPRELRQPTLSDHGNERVVPARIESVLNETKRRLTKLLVVGLELDDWATELIAPKPRDHEPARWVIVRVPKAEFEVIAQDCHRCGPARDATSSR